MKNSTAQERAIRFLKNLIDKDSKIGITRLPTIAELARQAKVAHVTMWKAMSHLKTAGILTATHGGGIKITMQPLDVTAETPPAVTTKDEVIARHSVQKWESLKAQMEREIIKGVYPPGSILPSPKELTRKYGVCYRTLKKTLDSLQSGERITAFKRSYRVPPLSAGRHNNTIVLIAMGDEQGNLRQWHPRTQECYRALESECSKINVNLEFMPFERLNTDLARLSSERKGHAGKIIEPDLVIGFLIWCTGILPDELTRMISWLSRISSNKAISLLEETGHTTVDAVPVCGSSVQFFTQGSTSMAGRDVARHLVARGHRHVAYISATHQALWSRMRMQGLRDAFAVTGMPDAVSGFTFDEYEFPGQMVGAENNAMEQIDALLKEGVTHADPGRSLLVRTLTALRSQLTPVMEREVLRDMIIPLFDRANAQPRITAWVCGSDTQAIEALAYLAAHHRNVPQDISVIGFDDGLEASFQKLTSYNFNSVALNQNMLQHVLTAKPAGTWKQPVPLEIEGFVVERHSAGKARIGG